MLTEKKKNDNVFSMKSFSPSPFFPSFSPPSQSSMVCSTCPLLVILSLRLVRVLEVRAGGDGGRGCRVGGSQGELAATEFFVHLPPQPRHVLLAEDEGLPECQTLAVLQDGRKRQRRRGYRRHGGQSECVPMMLSARINTTNTESSEKSAVLFVCHRTRVHARGDAHLQHEGPAVAVVVLTTDVLQQAN